MKKVFIMIIGAALLCGCSTKDKDMKLNLVATMPSLEEGFEKGVSACYGAIYNDTLYVAGGCNFPEKPVTEGGIKRYYKGILKTASQQVDKTTRWEKVGEMPATSAYGANIQCDDKWIIAGGMNENGATKKVICINLNDNCSVEKLPELPYAIDNTAGTMTSIDENTMVAAGGVNRDIFEDAISGRYELVSKADYMHKAPEWYKFNQYLMIYDVEKKAWKTLDKNKIYARAGALILSSEKGIFYIGGELKPGVRTPEIHLLTVD